MNSESHHEKKAAGVKKPAEKKLSEATHAHKESSKNPQEKTIKSEKSESANETKVAIVLVRGTIRSNPDVRRTLESLRLLRKNYCVVRNDSPSLRGMLVNAKDFITWGEVDSTTYKELVEKKGEKDSKNIGEIKPFFRLNPPKKGYGRKGVKKPFNVGGALGNRGGKINELIMRML